MGCLEVGLDVADHRLGILAAENVCGAVGGFDKETVGCFSIICVVTSDNGFSKYTPIAHVAA